MSLLRDGRDAECTVEVRKMIDTLDCNIKEINTLIRWDGGILSLVDLIKRGTIPLELAAYLMDGMRNGTSVLIGAGPGRAGKTTIMGALLGIIPSSDRVIVIEHASMIKGLIPGTRKRPKTFVIHEISNHGPEYLWGPEVVKVTKLVGPYTRLTSTLHADSISGAKEIFRRCGDEKAMNVFNFTIFMRYARRVVSEVWEFDTSNRSFHPIYSDAEGFTPYVKKGVDHRKWKRFLSHCLQKDINTIEKVAYALCEYTGEYRNLNG